MVTSMTSLYLRRRSILTGLMGLMAASGLVAQAPEAGVTLPPLKVIDTAYIDRSANACTDFDAFANGAWMKKDTIPAAYSSSGVARDMSDRNELVVRAVLEDAVKRSATLAPDSTEWKLGTFYGTCMDSTAIERAGASPLRQVLADIAAVSSRPELTAELARLQTTGVDVAFGFGPQVDPHDAAHYVAWFDQGGLGLPDRDYYVTQGASADSTRTAYVKHIARVLVLGGERPS